MSGVEELAVTMLALAILMYLLCKWGVFKCCSSRQAQLTQLTTVPSAPNQQAPTLALEVALVRNQTLQMQQSGIQQGQSEKCREMQRNTGKCREVKRNAEKIRKMQINAGKCRKCRKMQRNVEKRR